MRHRGPPVLARAPGGVQGTGLVELADRRHQAGPVVLIAHQGGDDAAGRAAAQEDLAHVTAQHRMRPELEEHPVPGLDQRADAVGEAHRLADVAGPVSGAPAGAGHGLAGDRGEQRHGRDPRRDRAKHLHQLIEDGVHQTAVVGHLDPQGPGEHARLGQLSFQLPELVHRSGQRHGRRAVDRRDAQAARCRQPVAGLVFGQPDGQHSAGPSGRRLQPGPVAAHQQGVLERESSADIGGADLADAVAQHRGRPYPGCFELGRQRHLEEEIGGLGDLGAGYP